RRGEAPPGGSRTRGRREGDFPGGKGPGRGAALLAGRGELVEARRRRRPDARANLGSTLVHPRREWRVTTKPFVKLSQASPPSCKGRIEEIQKNPRMRS